MLEKQARVKQAGATLKQAIADVAQENANNIKIAAHNQKVMLTSQGETKRYQKTAFSRMITAASELTGEAMS